VKVCLPHCVSSGLLLVPIEAGEWARLVHF